MTPQPVVALSGDDAAPAPRITTRGISFAIHEWRGSGPAALHVHHHDDEAELQRTPDRAAHATVYLRYASELLEPAS